MDERPSKRIRRKSYRPLMMRASNSFRSYFDSLPDCLVSHIFSSISTVQDFTRISSVDKRFNSLIKQVKCLHFNRLMGDQSGIWCDETIIRTVFNTTELEKLIMYCKISDSTLLACLLHSQKTLKSIELRMDDLAEKNNSDNSTVNILKALSCASELTSLTLWGLNLNDDSILSSLKPLKNLETLELVKPSITDRILQQFLVFCPKLKSISIVGSEGLVSPNIKSNHLTHLKLDMFSFYDSMLSVEAPNLTELEVQGAAIIKIEGNHSLKRLHLANSKGKVCLFDVNHLLDLTHLTLQGGQWAHTPFQNALNFASNVQELVTNVESCGDGNKFTFPETNVVDFLKKHSKMKKLTMAGGMFTSLNMPDANSEDENNIFPELDDVVINLRFVSEPMERLKSLLAILTLSPNLQSLKIGFSQVRNFGEDMDLFYRYVMLLQKQYPIIKLV